MATTVQSHRPWLVSRGNDVDPWPRYLSAIAGAWLFLSAFMWTHHPLQRTNTWIVGVVVFVAAITSIGIPRLRFFNTIVAVWLFVSAFIGTYDYTAWNNAIVAICVFVFSLVPSGHSGPLAQGPGTTTTTVGPTTPGPTR
jgi:hypothetical protein